jgi:hypothetical protein
MRVDASGPQCSARGTRAQSGIYAPRCPYGSPFTADFDASRSGASCAIVLRVWWFRVRELEPADAEGVPR